jgi:hypothetical protein
MAIMRVVHHVAFRTHISLTDLPSIPSSAFPLQIKLSERAKRVDDRHLCELQKRKPKAQHHHANNTPVQ